MALVVPRSTTGVTQPIPQPTAQSARSRVVAPAYPGSVVPPPAVTTGTLVIDLEGDVTSAADGTTMSTWVDTAANLVFTAPNSGARPTVRANALNGHTAIEFDGVADVVANSATGITGVTALSLVVIGTQTGPVATTNPGVISCQATSSANDYVNATSGGWYLSCTGGSGAAWTVAKLGGVAGSVSGETNVKTSSQAFGTYTLQTVDFNTAAASTTNYAVNGTNETPLTSTASNGVPLSYITIGSRRYASSSQEFAPLRLVRVLVYSGRLSSTDKTTVLNWAQTQYGVAAGATAATATGSITLDGTATPAAAAATAAGAITLAGSVVPWPWNNAAAWNNANTWPGPDTTGTASASAAGSVTLGGSAAATAQPTSAGSLTLNGSGGPRGQTTATGTITLGGSGGAQAPVSSSAGISLSGAVVGQARGATATGGLSLSGASAATASGSTSGSLTLNGSGGAPTASALASGSLQLAGSATPAARAAASGSLTLGSPGATAAGAGSASGQISLSGTGTATQPGSHANGSLTLNGSASAQATPSAVGGLSLNGSAAAQVTATATGGAIQLGGTSVASAIASGSGSLQLAGAAQLSALANAAGQIQLAGLATATGGVGPTLHAGPGETLLVLREKRLGVVVRELRVLAVARENHTQRVPADSRLERIPAENRTVRR